MRCGCYQLLHTLDDPSRGDDAKQSSQQGSRHHGQHDHHQRPLPGITCKLRLMEIVPPLGGCVVQLISKEATIQGNDDEDNTNRCPCIRVLHRGGKSISPSPNMQPSPQMSIFALHVLAAPSRVWLCFLLKQCTHHTSFIHSGTNLNYTLCPWSSLRLRSESQMTMPASAISRPLAAKMRCTGRNCPRKPAVAAEAIRVADVPIWITEKTRPIMSLGVALMSKER